MFFPFTVFNLVTMGLLSATAVIAVVRFRTRLDSNLPLGYYAALLAYWQSYFLTLDTYWVFTGVIFGLLLRFEFLGGFVERCLRTGEVLVWSYVVWRCLNLLVGG